jgi:predicted anti-sigma-YlaC factor YlaD
MRPATVASARLHFDRAIDLAGGGAAGPYVSWAESVCVARVDRACFVEALQSALKIDPDDHPPTRLANMIFRRRAEWLLANVDRWILPPLDETDTSEKESR